MHPLTHVEGRKRLRVAFGVADDLHDFAEAWLQQAGSLTGAKELRHADGAMVAVLYREGRYQVELCCVAADTLIPDHVHPHADTIEVSVAGPLRLQVNGVEPFAAIPDERLERLSKGTGIRINATDVHGTYVPPPGAVFLSIQRWVAEPKSVLTDYSGQPLGGLHRELLR